MDPFDPKALSLPGLEHRNRESTLKTKPPRHRPGDRFLKGPIPLDWLTKASMLPGKSLQVGLAVWFRAGTTKSREVALTRALAAEFGVDRYAKARALDHLEQAGLVSVQRISGRNPVVTIFDAEEASP